MCREHRSDLNSSVSVSEPRLVDHVGFLMVSLTPPLPPTILPPPTSSTGFPQLCLMFDYWSASGSTKLLDEVSRMMIVLGSSLQIQQSIIGITLLPFYYYLFILRVLFGSSLGHRTIRPLVLGHPGRVRCGSL